jgi:hypothetical protein
MEDKDATMKKLLLIIDENGEIADSRAVAASLNLSHDEVMGVINSMCAAELVVTSVMCEQVVFVMLLSGDHLATFLLCMLHCIVVCSVNVRCDSIDRKRWTRQKAVILVFFPHHHFTPTDQLKSWNEQQKGKRCRKMAHLKYSCCTCYRCEWNNHVNCWKGSWGTN